MIVTHDMGEAFALGNRVGVVDEGALVAFADSDTVRRSSDPRIRRLLDSLPDSRMP
jgi:ABC-type proline/glycine betaine transport system ATPase subunit